MHQIQIDNIAITNPKSHITDPIHIAITFSALEALPHPLTWKLIYVGSAFTETHDQTLEQFQIQNISEPSTLSFELQCPPPDLTLLPREEVICTTAMIISVQYLEQEFLRIGYYIYNTFLGEQDEAQLPLEEVIRNAERVIIAEKPRITKFQIKWERKSAQPARDMPNPSDKRQQLLFQNQSQEPIKQKAQGYMQHPLNISQNQVLSDHINSQQLNLHLPQIGKANKTQEKPQTDAEKEQNA